MRGKYFPFKIVTPVPSILNSGARLLQKTKNKKITKLFGQELVLRYSNTYNFFTRLLNSLDIVENKA